MRIAPQEDESSQVRQSRHGAEVDHRKGGSQRLQKEREYGMRGSLRVEVHQDDYEATNVTNQEGQDAPHDTREVVV
jgi:hypothetical protein